MTEEQIINCLNDTVGNEHIGIYCTDKNGNFTTVIKLTDMVDFINRQKAEIERLQKEKFDSLNCQFAEMYSTTLNIAVKKAKSEAIKEFAEKFNSLFAAFDDYDTLHVYEIKERIDFVKGMVGDSE